MPSDLKLMSLDDHEVSSSSDDDEILNCVEDQFVHFREIATITRLLIKSENAILKEGNGEMKERTEVDVDVTEAVNEEDQNKMKDIEQMTAENESNTKERGGGEEEENTKEGRDENIKDADIENESSEKDQPVENKDVNEEKDKDVLLNEKEEWKEGDGKQQDEPEEKKCAIQFRYFSKSDPSFENPKLASTTLLKDVLERQAYPDLLTQKERDMRDKKDKTLIDAKHRYENPKLKFLSSQNVTKYMAHSYCGEMPLGTSPWTRNFKYDFPNYRKDLSHESENKYDKNRGDRDYKNNDDGCKQEDNDDDVILESIPIPERELVRMDREEKETEMPDDDHNEKMGYKGRNDEEKDSTRDYDDAKTDHYNTAGESKDRNHYNRSYTEYK